MSTYRLDRLFAPRSLTIVGASPREKSLGRAIIRNVRSAAFGGPVHLVNPRYAEIDGIATVKSWRCESPGSYVLSVSNPSVAAPEVTRALVGAGADVLSIGEARHSLEDVYLELIDEDVEARKH